MWPAYLITIMNKHYVLKQITVVVEKVSEHFNKLRN